MSPPPDTDPDPRGDDMLAAEYVLGVLSAGERAAVAGRIAREPAFARLVDGWEVRLSPLGEGYDEVAPPASVKAAIDARLSHPQRTGLRRLTESLALWRGLAAAGAVAAVIALALPYLGPPAPPSGPNLVASLAAEGSGVSFLAVYDAARHDIGLSQVSGERAAGTDYELWMIEGDNAPVSLGIIPPGAAAHLAVSPEARAKLARGAVLAVSVEPAGGSPTGQPTGPVVAAGDLKDI